MRRPNFIFHHPGLTPLARYMWVQLYRDSGMYEEDRGTGKCSGHSRSSFAQDHKLPQLLVKEAVDQLLDWGLILMNPRTRKLTVVPVEGCIGEPTGATPMIRWWRDAIGYNKRVTVPQVARILRDDNRLEILDGLRWRITAEWSGVFVHDGEASRLAGYYDGWELVRWSVHHPSNFLARDR